MKHIIHWSIFILLMILSFFLIDFDFPYFISIFVFSIAISYGIYLLLFKNHLYPWNLFGYIIAVIGTNIIIHFDNIIITVLVICITLIHEIKAPKK